jgi:hypothetical protein
MKAPAGRQLAVSVLAAVVTVATGIAINASFAPGRGLIWPWLLLALALALLPPLSRRRDPEPEPEPDGGGAVTGTADLARAAALAELAAAHLPVREMPVAWREPAEGASAGDISVSVSGTRAGLAGRPAHPRRIR